MKLHHFAIFAYVPRVLLTDEESTELIGCAEGAWVPVGRVAAESRGAAITKASRLSWCRDERARRYRAEPLDGDQPPLFTS
jgi:hypothetical protein